MSRAALGSEVALLSEVDADPAPLIASFEETTLTLNSKPVASTGREMPPLCVIMGLMAHLWDLSFCRAGLVSHLGQSL